LHIGRNDIPDNWVAKIIDQVEQQGRMGTLCAVPIKELKQDAILELNLHGNQLGTEGTYVLSTYLMHNTRLTALDISAAGTFSSGWNVQQHGGLFCTAVGTMM
jgi:hypothetical protein